MRQPEYTLITPVRNEQDHVRATIDSVISQTALPARWIVVDDGSSDHTAKIVCAAAAQHPWIQLVRRADRGFRKPGTGVMEAFFDGYAQIGHSHWDFLVKLDGDLSFAKDYFEKCFEHFRTNTRLGIGGGTICRIADGRAVPEVKSDPPFHVRGATKIYRRECWEAIGGLIQATGWDTMDEVRANMLGWQTYSFRELKVIQLRETGGANGIWGDSFKNGRANYIVGYHPLFMAAKCLRRLRQRPYCIISVALWCGFLSGYLARVSHLAEPELIRYLRAQQLRALLGKESLWTMNVPELTTSATPQPSPFI
jgi:poly-beta-1,6-N-acetyl-D-glucosamine synthase